jgi:hypothetical protein
MHLPLSHRAASFSRPAASFPYPRFPLAPPSQVEATARHRAESLLRLAADLQQLAAIRANTPECPDRRTMYGWYARLDQLSHSSSGGSGAGSPGQEHPPGWNHTPAAAAASTVDGRASSRAQQLALLLTGGADPSNSNSNDTGGTRDVAKGGPDSAPAVVGAVPGSSMDLAAAPSFRSQGDDAGDDDVLTYARIANGRVSVWDAWETHFDSRRE